MKQIYIAKIYMSVTIVTLMKKSCFFGIEVFDITISKALAS